MKQKLHETEITITCIEIRVTWTFTSYNNCKIVFKRQVYKVNCLPVKLHVSVPLGSDVCPHWLVLAVTYFRQWVTSKFYIIRTLKKCLHFPITSCASSALQWVGRSLSLPSHTWPTTLVKDEIHGAHLSQSHPISRGLPDQLSPPGPLHIRQSPNLPT